MKHTPGPWTLTHVAGGNFAVQEFQIRGPFGKTPNVYPIFNRNAQAIDGATVYCKPEDARLMAAAPDLLEALQAALPVLSGESDTESARQFAESEVRAAIAKATS